MNNKLTRWLLIGAIALFALELLGGMFTPLFFGGASNSLVGYGYGCAGNWGYHSPMMMGWRTPFSAFGMITRGIIPLAVLLLVIAGIVWIIQNISKPQIEQ